MHIILTLLFSFQVYIFPPCPIKTVPANRAIPNRNYVPRIESKGRGFPIPGIPGNIQKNPFYLKDSKMNLTVIDAIRRYASHRPLDLLSPAEIQKDLLAIAGDVHKYERQISGETCLLCGRSRTDSIHGVK